MALVGTPVTCYRTMWHTHYIVKVWLFSPLESIGHFLIANVSKYSWSLDVGCQCFEKALRILSVSVKCRFMCVTFKIVFWDLDVWSVKELLEFTSSVLLISPNLWPNLILLNSLMVTLAKPQFQPDAVTVEHTPVSWAIFTTHISSYLQAEVYKHGVVTSTWS